MDIDDLHIRTKRNTGQRIAKKLQHFCIVRCNQEVEQFVIRCKMNLLTKIHCRGSCWQLPSSFVYQDSFQNNFYVQLGINVHIVFHDHYLKCIHECLGIGQYIFQFFKFYLHFELIIGKHLFILLFLRIEKHTHQLKHTSNFSLLLPDTTCTLYRVQ